ncbi:MAG: hypothetical protein GY861_26100 [bacterium]|nr:hypothetical protein [bacterium]
MNKYWVQYQYCGNNWLTPDGWNKISKFVTTGEKCEYKDLESWWLTESAGSCQHELLQVVKL